MEQGNERTKHITHIDAGAGHVIVSTVWATDCKMYETMAFEADSNGNITDWSGLGVERCLGDDKQIKKQHDEMCEKLKK